MRNKKQISLIVIAMSLLVILVIIITLIVKSNTSSRNSALNGYCLPEYVDVELIDIDGHARRGEKLEGVNDIVIHYVGNPNTTAMANRNYFNNEGTTVSSHFIVGLEGEIIQCVPLDEKSSASNHRNIDTISIEVCHEDETGKFNEKTYNSLVKLTAWLCAAAKLDESHVIRHYDVTGKLCPLYYVEHEDAWNKFKQDVADKIPLTKLVSLSD